MAERKNVVGSDGVDPELLSKYEMIHKAHTEGNTIEEVTKHYDKDGVANVYEELLAQGGCGYNGPRYAAEQLKSLTSDKNIKILDVAAGTGFVGQELHKLGFTNIDALEPSSAMLEKARDKNLYNNLMCDKISEDKLDIGNDAYDVCIIAGGLGEGHIPCAGLKEIIRITKPGGWLVIVTRKDYLYQVKEYAGRLQAFMTELEEQGKWNCIKNDIVPEYSFSNDGIIFIFKIQESGYSSYHSTIL